MGGRIYRPEDTAMLEFPLIGKVKIGMRTEKGYPTSLDYFRPVGKYAGMFTQALGEKPQQIQIIFTNDDPSKVCCEEYQFRDNSGALVAKGDGREFMVWNGKGRVPFSTKDYPDIMAQVSQRYGKKPRFEGDNGWDVVLTMHFVIPAVRGIVGEWCFQTKGAASSIRNIRNSFDGVQMLRGTVTTTVFDLSVQFAKSDKPGNASRFPVVSMVANDTRIDDIRKAIAPEQNLSLLLPNNEK